jgi:hypothetical protein
VVLAAWWCWELDDGFFFPFFQRGRQCLLYGRAPTKERTPGTGTEPHKRTRLAGRGPNRFLYVGKYLHKKGGDV